MNKIRLSYISIITGWTAGFLVFAFTELWTNIVGWIILIGGTIILIFKFCDNNALSTKEVVENQK